MLRIESQNLPDVDLAYVALRLSFFETLERITLANQLGVVGESDYGFLTEVPFLRGVAAQVQLDLLLDCWHKLRSHDAHRATLVEEAVLFAACETAARIIEDDEDLLCQFLKSGPRQLATQWDPSLADELRFLHLSLPNDGDFLLISQFQDVPPDEGRQLKEKFGLDVAACDELFEVLGRWHVSGDFRENGRGLLSSAEIELACGVLGLAPPVDPTSPDQPLAQ